ncbi:putative 60S ribosomal protein L7a [Trypanosoma conorhini]|uniref:Putative 60S ribosomal protein L7a n=1 Tax=Trypanosoma conorhini TaxID=83891 RepID=A0A422P5J3_9TRYP|nr:putative 60S ribosomal protein L7a [Trypanosoma conorhini]RNF12988.1 putative 60S ribosomal protein L7a [Trypanosoma conorhini]
MEAYQSLSNRVASMEDLLRRSESAMVMVLQRLKALEEHVSASEARGRGDQATRSEELASRMNRGFENQNGRMEAMQGALSRQASSVQVLEERLQGTSKALEQKMNSDIAGCYQRLQALEGSLMSALRNVESMLQSQSSATKSLEQILRGDIQSVQQHASGEIVGVRQRVDAVDSALRASLAELHKSMSGDVKLLAESLLAKMQSSAQSTEASLLALDQRVKSDMQSLHDSLGHDLAAVRQGLNAENASTQDALRALYTTLANDVKNVSSRQQSSEAAQQLAYQQLRAEVAAQRQLVETVDSNWRSSLTNLGEKVQDGWKSHMSQLVAVDVGLQQRFSQVNAQVEQLAAQLRQTVESLTHSLEIKMNSLVHLREDVVAGRQSLRAVQDEQQRLREEISGFSAMLERSGMQLRSLMEAAVRVSHSDLLERIKPLSSYRSEMHSAIAAALNKVWSEAHGAFTPQRDMDALQSQVQFLDNAVRNEILLLIERTRALERGGEGQPRPASVTENAAPLNPDPGALVPASLFGELNNVWGELRSLQNRLGMPREEVLAAISDTRRQVLDATLEIAKQHENEVRDVLEEIRKDVSEMVQRPSRPREADARSGDAGNDHQPRRTVVRVYSKTPPRPPPTEGLPPLVRLKKLPNSHSVLEVHPTPSASEPAEMNPFPPVSPQRDAGAAAQLPPLVQLPSPPQLVSAPTSLSPARSTSFHGGEHNA